MCSLEVRKEGVDEVTAEVEEVIIKGPISNKLVVSSQSAVFFWKSASLIVFLIF